MPEELSRIVSPAQETAQELTFQELIMRRLAGGLALTELCKDLQELSVNYPNVEVRGPERGFDGLTRVEVVDSKGIRVNRLHRKSITADRLNRELLRTASSIFVPRYCEATDINMRDSAKGETYVTLEFDRASADVLLEERKATWKVLARLGQFSLYSRPWLERNPDLVVAYMRPDKTVLETDLMVEDMEDTIKQALPIIVELAPAWQKPEEVEGTANEEFNFNTELTTVIIDELTDLPAHAITIHDLKRFIQEHDIDVSLSVATRLFNALRDAMPHTYIRQGVIKVDNFVTGIPLRPDKAREFGLKVSSIPDLQEINMYDIPGLGLESMALFHAYVDALLAPPDER